MKIAVAVLIVLLSGASTLSAAQDTPTNANQRTASNEKRSDMNVTAPEFVKKAKAHGKSTNYQTGQTFREPGA